MVEEAIVLAGGLGTRLRKVVSDVPKPMADINGKPFLEYLLRDLKKKRIEKVVLSVGYKYEVIRNYFGEEFNNIKIEYSIEPEPLGTGGAIKEALNLVEEEDVFILNGDTFFDIDLKDLYRFHKEKEAALTLTLKQLKRFDRYGSVKIDENFKIIGFEEKKYKEEGFINGGVYILNLPFFKNLELPEKFSFERDFLERYYELYDFYGVPFDAYFIDIGILEDYERAKKEFKRFKYS